MAFEYGTFDSASVAKVFPEARTRRLRSRPCVSESELRLNSGIPHFPTRGAVESARALREARGAAQGPVVSGAASAKLAPFLSKTGDSLQRV